MPQEVFIHTWLYKTRPDVQCVVHVHPLSVVLFTICNKPIQPLYGAYDPSGLRLLVEGLATYPRSITVSSEGSVKNLPLRWVRNRLVSCAVMGSQAPRRMWKMPLAAIKLNDAAVINYQASASRHTRTDSARGYRDSRRQDARREQSGSRELELALLLQIARRRRKLNVQVVQHIRMVPIVRAN